MVTRWIGNVHRYLTLLEEADRSPVVEGSTGQPKPNGLYELAYKIEDKIRADEAQLGIGPKNGLSLGLLAIQEQRTLQEMNARYGDDLDVPDEEDPRLRIIPGLAE
ncbi:hypothetical protein AB0J28_16885 [Streptosporangium canum]|uniref:hypothetical protein n=1 Tax=Streptosporangium canum TaxID=324952 RepID=UPI0034223CF3